MNFNKVIMLGRVGTDPEFVDTNGGRLAKFRFAVTEKKRKDSAGNQNEETCWIDVECWNGRDYGPKLADIIQNYVSKGDPLHLEGKLVHQQWQDKTTGQNRSKHVLRVFGLQLIGGKRDGQGGGQRQEGGQQGGGNDVPPDDGAGSGGDGGDIPFGFVIGALAAAASAAMALA